MHCGGALPTASIIKSMRRKGTGQLNLNYAGIQDFLVFRPINVKSLIFFLALAVLRLQMFFKFRVGLVAMHLTGAIGL